MVASRIVELQHYLEFVALSLIFPHHPHSSYIAPIYRVRLLPVFKKFISANRKYADENYEPPEIKAYYIDCISTYRH